MKALILFFTLALGIGAAFSQAPGWLRAARAGGDGSDYGYGIAADGAGNACICGLFEADAAFGPLTLTSAGNLDICVAKWKPEK